MGEGLITELVGVSGFVTNVYGNFLVARKNIYGWYWRILAIMLWGMYAYLLNGYAGMFNSVVFVGINIYGIYSWRRLDRLSASERS